MTAQRRQTSRPLLHRAAWVLRHPVRYVGRFGFGAFQVLLLPVLAAGAALTTFYAGQIR